MATYAQIDQFNEVINIIELSDDESPSEEAGALFLEQMLGGAEYKFVWSREGDGRSSLAAIGQHYDEASDDFVL